MAIEVDGESDESNVDRMVPYLRLIGQPRIDLGRR
jgi:hypothetical protein